MTYTKQEHHAVMAALIYRSIRELRPENADALIAKTASDYGLDRGRIARENVLSQGDELTLENYFSYKSLRVEDGVFEEYTVENGPDFITEVTKCCWIAAWEKYGLLEHGKQYCLYCDPFMAKGYNDFKLETPCLIAHNGSEKCRFYWPDMTLDEDAVHAKKEALNGRFVMSWDELTKHLMECARNTLNGEESGLGDTVLQMAEEAFAKTVRD